MQEGQRGMRFIKGEIYKFVDSHVKTRYQFVGIDETMIDCIPFQKYVFLSSYGYNGSIMFMKQYLDALQEELFYEIP